MSEVSAGDLALMNQGGGFGNGMWNNPFVYLVWIWAFRMFGGYGDSAGVNSAAAQGALTRAELYDGLTLNNIQDAIQSVERGLCSLGYDIAGQIGGINTNILQQTNAMQNTINQNAANILANITQNQFSMQQMGCEINRNIDAVRYENAQNTCAITSAIHEDGEATRALITKNLLDSYRDNLQSANLVIANRQQADSIISSVVSQLSNGCCCNSF